MVKMKMAKYPIPSAALDDRLAFVGTTGSGKTYAAGTAVERLLASGARVVIVDPLDVWWGLRVSPDGEGASKFKVVIFGGAHGDLPLSEQAGALIGETVAGMAESCVISLGGMATKTAERRFMLAFLDAIYRKAEHAKYGPFHMVFDEADLFAPQKASEPMLQSRMEEIVRRGRVRGFIPWLITQRPAVLSKDVLSQADGLIALKLTASQDRDAIGAWIEGMADRAQGREILGSLPAMQQGQGVVWIPGRNVLQTATFPAKATFDSSRTPKRGEIVRNAVLKPLDLGVLKERLAGLDAETKANDPKALKAEIARLTRELVQANKITATPAEPLPAVIANADEIEKARKEGECVGIAIGIARAQQALNALRVDAPAEAKERPQPAQRAAPKAKEQRGPASDGVTVPQQRVLDAIAWWRAFGIEQPTREQVGFIAGYSPSSGGFANLTGQLRSSGSIDYPAGGRLMLTDVGAALSNIPSVALTRDAFHASVRAKLSAPQVRVLDPALAAYPNPISSAEIADIAGYSASSGGFANLRGSLKTLTLIDYPGPGQVRAADWLFPETAHA